MKKIVFPGNHRQPAEAAYNIVIEDDGSIPVARIVVWQVPGEHRGTSPWNTNSGRDNVLNRILETELAGVRTEFVRFTVAILEEDGGRVHAMDFPIHLDLDDYTARGNPHEVLGSNPLSDAFNWIVNKERRISFRSYDVVAGCARHFTIFEEGTGTANPAALLARAGYVPSKRQALALTATE